MAKKSKVTSPVQRVWEIASSMPRAARKDVIAACVEKGINENTARTQYQWWSKATPKQRKAKIAA